MRLIIARMGGSYWVYIIYIRPPQIFRGGYSAGFCYLYALLSHNVYYRSDIASPKLANPL